MAARTSTVRQELTFDTLTDGRVGLYVATTTEWSDGRGVVHDLTTRVRTRVAELTVSALADLVKDGVEVLACAYAEASRREG